MSAAIDIDGVSVRYGDLVALDDVTVRVESGGICGLVGMNGAGKSTLMKAAMGVIRPGGGTVRLAGRAPGEARRAGVVAYVPQSEAVDWDFPISVREVVTMGRYGFMRPGRRASRADIRCVDEAIERVELPDLTERPIGQLSGGQRKRVFVARAIAQRASVLLLDEPFAGVDKRTEATITRLLRELAAGGASVLIATHDLAALPELATEAVLLARSVIAHGTPVDVLAPANLARAFGMDPLRRDEQV
ncbi:metal ABC transporter ATP-binding protein [Rarobacter faecitabidus]|uniref:Manganese transport system ATP-binding protein n=1 Tax=Rarobacter faecitabidus TaxID=13243 RepID=A0A542ZX15_RARFA|nr:ABC transporter ATP-binding protein [Rarobacter faecitabidus]TQL64796.1 manganese transport system ATP-binding protein [Rarobacter faecitabidus]